MRLALLRRREFRIAAAGIGMTVAPRSRRPNAGLAQAFNLERHTSAVAGLIEKTTTLETGSDDRLANMHAFAAAALNLFLTTLSSR